MKIPLKGKLFSRPPLLAKLSTTRAVTPVQKGHAFEKFVISLFDAKYFSLIEWRSDKYFEGIFPKSNGYPDLEFELQLKRMVYPFAIECKYRSVLPDNCITWCEWHQLYNYQEFAEKRKIQVFVVLGYGGDCNLPEELYCVPLPSIKSVIIDRTFLQTYRHHNLNQRFYLDTDTMKLS